MTDLDTVFEVARVLVIRYTRAVGEHGWFFALALLVILSNLPRFRLSIRSERAVRFALIAATSIAGVAYAWSLLWASDDSYITFRYAENLATGHGLVWNPGERVEGYTDFLWTVIIAGFIRAGADPGQAAIMLSLASFLLVIFLCARLPSRLTGQPLLWGPAPLLCAFHYTTASFATAGLETMFGALLALFAVERVEARRPAMGGLAATLAAMTHPDHAIFYAGLAAALAVDRRRRRELVRYVAPFALVFVPYFLWRWSYYGDLMPNTYYAKSAGRAYFEQGAVYFLATFIGGGLACVVPIAALGAYQIRHTVTGRFALIALPLYVAYVAKIGGDFMFGRLFVPVLIFSFLLADVAFRTLVAKNHRLVAFALCAPAALAALPIRIVNESEIFYGIADERTFTPITDFSKMVSPAGGYALGHAVNRRLNWPGHKPIIGMHNIGMAGYYGKVPVFDLRGLTSRSVAHLPVGVRGRPGHEKLASPGHAVEAGVELSQEAVYPPPYGALTEVSLDGFSFFLVHEDPALVRKLRSKGAPVRSPDRLERLFTSTAQKSDESLACDLWFVREYYFSSNADAVRRDRIVQAAVAAQADLQPVQALLLESRSPSSHGFAKVRSISVDPTSPAWHASGDAAAWSHEPMLPYQGLPIGSDGPLVFTSTKSSLDDSVGSLASAPFVVEGDVMTVQVAGGMDLESLSVALVVDGKEVRKATGCRSEWVGTRVWDIRPFRGSRASIAVTDDSTRPWGHLSVGAITEWRAPS